MGMQSVGHNHVLGGLRYWVQRHGGFQPLLPSLVSTKSLWWARWCKTSGSLKWRIPILKDTTTQEPCTTSLNLGNLDALYANLEFRSVSKFPFQLHKVTGVAFVGHQFNFQRLSPIQGCLRSATCSTLQDPCAERSTPVYRPIPMGSQGRKHGSTDFWETISRNCWDSSFGKLLWLDKQEISGEDSDFYGFSKLLLVSRTKVVLMVSWHLRCLEWTKMDQDIDPSATKAFPGTTRSHVSLQNRSQKCLLWYVVVLA